MPRWFLSRSNRSFFTRSNKSNQFRVGKGQFQVTAGEREAEEERSLVEEELVNIFIMSQVTPDMLIGDEETQDLEFARHQ
jgi:hypothetical protein